jgi:NAD(P)-dependent dehydrogenase (short-subunit alcohol dehydrogenase family)
MSLSDVRDQPAEADAVTIITGAGSGLGRELAKTLAKRGRPLALVGRRPERLWQTRVACIDAGIPGDKCRVLPLDVTEQGAAKRVVTDTISSLGGIAAVVNNAGLARFARLEDGDPADWQRMLWVNVLAPAMLIREAIPALRASGGVVINVGSIGGMLSLPERALYGASKAALAHLTRSLARELAPAIRVNAVLPGPVDTEMYDHLNLDEQAVAGLREDLVRSTPLGRMGRVEEVVPWIEHLLGAAGRWVTGSLVVIDGGRSC